MDSPLWGCDDPLADMSQTHFNSDLLGRRIALNKGRIQRLIGLATHPTAKLELQRAIDDLNDAASWTMRKDLDAWTDLARSVSATIDFVEWRLRTLERVLQTPGPAGAKSD